MNLDVCWDAVLRPTTIAPFRIHRQIESQVACLKLFPNLSADIAASFFRPAIKGVVLETYGAGNAPNRNPQLLHVFKEASERGIVIVNCSQCRKGFVSDIYETGKALSAVGIIPGGDMTTEVLFFFFPFKRIGSCEKERDRKIEKRKKKKVCVGQTEFFAGSSAADRDGEATNAPELAWRDLAAESVDAIRDRAARSA